MIITDTQKKELGKISKELGITDVETFQRSLNLFKMVLRETANGDVRAVRELSDILEQTKEIK